MSDIDLQLKRRADLVPNDRNPAVESFPASLVAAITGFRTRPFSELDRAVPHVSFER